jgi:hypothetical protein
MLLHVPEPELNRLVSLSNPALALRGNELLGVNTLLFPTRPYRRRYQREEQ